MMRYSFGSMTEDELIEKLAGESSAEGVRACLQKAGFTLKKSEAAPEEEGDGDDSKESKPRDFGFFQKRAIKKAMKEPEPDAY